MLKKTMAFVLTLVMTTALAVPMISLAAGSSADYTLSSDANTSSDGTISSGQSKDVTIEYATKTDVPTLNLTISGGGGLVMNPYGIKRTSSDFGIENNANKILSTKLLISSTTVLPVKIGATVRAVVKPAKDDHPITLGTSIGPKDTGKKVAMYLAVAKADGEASALPLGTFPTADVSGDETKPGVLLIRGAYDANNTRNPGEMKNDSIYTIPASDGTTANAKKCVFRFCGDMVAEPLNDPWVPEDKITPTVILNFQLQKVAATTTTSTGG